MSREPLYGADHFAREDPKQIPAKVRQAVLDRDGAQCQSCGRSGEGVLQLHHVIYRSQGGGHHPSNLVTLCFICHERVHRGDLDITLLEIAPGVYAAFPSVPPRRPRR